jgi:glyoxylase-like metal-dependent hydrolase (beta-lactamase superfamily II)
MFESVTETVSSFVGTALAGPPPRGLPKLHPVARLSPRVVRVLGGNPGAFTLQGTNAYLIGTGSRRWLLDTGEGRPAFVANLRAAMEAEGVTELEGILLTHWHRDHVGGLADVRRLARELEREGSEGGATREESRPLVAYKRVRHDKGETAIDVRSVKKGVDGVAVAEARRAYVDVKDGDVFASVPGATLRALFTPGHTEDHVCFVLEEEGAIFAGDCVLNGNTAVFENLAQYSRSLETMRAELEKANGARADGEKANVRSRDDSRPRNPPVGRLYPSHGDVIRDGSKKLEQYARHRETREAMFLKTLVQHWRDRPERGGVTKRELTRSVYCDAGVSPLVLRTACEQIAAQHLGKLVEEGRAIREDRTVYASWVPRTIVSFLPFVFAETRYRPSAAEMA